MTWHEVWGRSWGLSPISGSEYWADGAAGQEGGRAGGGHEENRLGWVSGARGGQGLGVEGGLLSPRQALESVGRPLGDCLRVTCT